MRNYIIRRILIAIPTFLGITVLTYLISSLAPGGPIEILMSNPYITAEEIERKKVELGLNQPVLIQYVKWLLQLLQGNMGYSIRTSQPVVQLLAERIGPTLLLTGSSILLSIVVALPMGIMAAVKPYSGWDYISSGVSFLAVATPNFFAGLVLVYLFSLKLPIFPVSGMYTIGKAHTLGDLAIHLVLPCVVLAFQQVGSLVRYVRSSMLEVLEEDYIRTARAKGLKEKLVICRHGLHNALVPVVTIIGMQIPFMVGGAVVTEQIFGWPGIGTLMVQSINARDYPVIMGITVWIAVMVLIGNLIVDLIYGVLDPRISYK